MSAADATNKGSGSMSDGRLLLKVEAFRAVLTTDQNTWGYILELLTLAELADVKQAADYLSKQADAAWRYKHRFSLGTSHGG